MYLWVMKKKAKDFILAVLALALLIPCTLGFAKYCVIWYNVYFG